MANVWTSSSRAWDLNLCRNLIELEIAEWLLYRITWLLSDWAPLLILGFGLWIHLTFTVKSLMAALVGALVLSYLIFIH